VSDSRWGYRAANVTGAVVEGEIDAPTEQSAVDALRRRALWVTELWLKSGTVARSTTRGSRKIPSGALAAVMRAVSTLLASGVSLERALGYAVPQAPAGALRDAFQSVRTDVRNGSALSEAFGTQKLFPSIFSALAATGEATGTLDSALARLAEHVERSDELRARVRAALLYPMLLGIAAIFGVTVILIVVIPRFATLIEQAGGKLPLSTQLLMGASSIVTRGWPLWLALAVGGVLGWQHWSAQPGNRARWHGWRASMPVIGNLERSLAASRYTRTLALALPSGVDLLTAMRLSRASVDNVAIATQLAEAERRVRDGSTLAQSIGNTLPPLAVQLLDAGETSGALAALSARAADAFDGEVQRALAQAVTLIEPILILGFGGVIGFVALGLLQAIYGINASGL
jgi:type II secretory pathway component PulF